MPLDPKDVGRYIFEGDDDKKHRAPKTPFLPYDDARSPYKAAREANSHGASRDDQVPQSAALAAGSFCDDRRDASVVSRPGKGTHVSIGVPSTSIQPSDWLKAQTMRDPALTPHETGTKEASL